MNPAQGIAFVFPSLDRGYYWHPIFKHFVKKHPTTVVLTSEWTGYAKGYEAAFDVCVLSKLRTFSIGANPAKRRATARVLLWMPVGELLKVLFAQRPGVIFVSAFSVATLAVVAAKPFGKWKVVVIYDGSSPNVDAKDSTLRTLARKVMAKAADAFVTNSLAGRTYLCEHLGIAGNKVYQQPFQVPDDRAIGLSLPREELVRASAPVTFLYVGRLIALKGVDVLIRACGFLAQTQQDFQLIVVGDGEQKPELARLALELGLTTQVRFVDKLPYDQLGAYFQAADVFVLPSFEDTWGLVVLEAMLFGKAILCSERAGASELITNGVNGHTFSPDDPEQLARLMGRFLEDASLAAQMGNRARASLTYTPEDSAGLFSRIVEELA